MGNESISYMYLTCMEIKAKQSKANITRRYAKSASSTEKTETFHVGIFLFFFIRILCLCVFFLLMCHLYMYNYDRHTRIHTHTRIQLKNVACDYGYDNHIMIHFVDSLYYCYYDRALYWNALHCQKSAIRQIYINDLDISQSSAIRLEYRRIIIIMAILRSKSNHNKFLLMQFHFAHS